MSLSVTVQSGNTIASTMPGRPPPEPTSSTDDGPRVSEMRHDRKRIENVLDQHLPRIADRREVVHGIPFGEQRDVVEQLVELGVAQIEAEFAGPLR